MKLSLFALGTGLFLNSVIVIFAEGFNWVVAIMLLLGMLLVLWSVFYKKINTLAKNKKAVDILKKVFAICISGELLFVTFVQIYGMNDTVTYDEDAIIVLGAAHKDGNMTSALKLRLDKTLEYLEKNPDAIVVVSGSMGKKEKITESWVMMDYLVKNGVAVEQIIMEDKATSTAENMTFSKELLDSIFYNPYEFLTDEAFAGQSYTVAFVTNDFHICRSAMLSVKRGFQGVTHIHADSLWYNYVPYYIRETMAMVKSIIFD